MSAEIYRFPSRFSKHSFPRTRVGAFTASIALSVVLGISSSSRQPSTDASIRAYENGANNSTGKRSDNLMPQVDAVIQEPPEFAKQFIKGSESFVYRELVGGTIFVFDHTVDTQLFSLQKVDLDGSNHWWKLTSMHTKGQYYLPDTYIKKIFTDQKKSP